MSAVAGLAVASGPPVGASAAAPTVQVRQVNTAQTIAAGGLCPFDVTFTGEGDVRITTSQDGTRQSIHGSLEHTICSQRVTLSSPGPAPVHIDLATGVLPAAAALGADPSVLPARLGPLEARPRPELRLTTAPPSLARRFLRAVAVEAAAGVFTDIGERLPPGGLQVRCGSYGPCGGL